METFRVAAVQATPVFFDRDATVAKACDLIAQASAEGARIIAFPETFVSGYPVWLDEAPSAARWNHQPAKEAWTRLVESALVVPGPHIERIGAAAKRANAYVVLGAHELGGSTIYCAQLFFGPDGALLGVHRKLMPTYQERMVWGQGDGSGLIVLDTPLGKLGALNCWEHWMPLTRQAMHLQGETIHVASWPSVHELHQIASRHYAFEGRAFVIAAGTILRRRDLPDVELLQTIPGPPEDFLQRGGSAIIGPDGLYLAGPVYDEETIVYADVDPRRTIEERLTLDVAGHYNRPDIFTFTVNTARLSGR
jgi:nitrilase